MKPVVAIVQGEDAGQTAEALNGAGLNVTRLASSGGFLQQGNATLLVVAEEDPGGPGGGADPLRLPFAEPLPDPPMPPMVEPGEVFVPFPVKVQVGGATIFVLDVERFVRLEGRQVARTSVHGVQSNCADVRGANLRSSGRAAAASRGDGGILRPGVRVFLDQ